MSALYPSAEASHIGERSRPAAASLRSGDVDRPPPIPQRFCCSILQSHTLARKVCNFSGSWACWVARSGPKSRAIFRDHAVFGRM